MSSDYLKAQKNRPWLSQKKGKEESWNKPSRGVSGEFRFSTDCSLTEPRKEETALTMAMDQTGESFLLKVL